MGGNLWATTKSMILACVIALLVWVYAEGQSLATRAMNVAVAVSPEPASGVVIRVKDPNFKGVARVRLEGSSRTIDDAASQLGASLKLAPGMPGVPVEPGDSRQIDLREVISALPELAGLGSSVAEVDPRYIAAEVVAIGSRELPVRVELGAEVALDGEAKVSPGVCAVRAPESLLTRLPEGAVLVATITASELAKLGDGPQRVQATVKLAGGANLPTGGVQVSPESVTVSLRVRRQAESFTIASVPVWYSLPPTEDAGKWSVEVLDKFLSDVTIAGPGEGVRRVRAGEAPVKAVIELSTEDLQRGVPAARATFPGLPAGVTASASNPEVRVKISKREGGGKGAGQ